MTWMRGWVLVVLAGTMACGARSVLDTPGATTSAGGGGSSTGTPTGGGGNPGGGGAGGIEVTCDALAVGFGPLTLPWPDPFYHSHRPQLVPLEDDSIAVVNDLLPVEGPAPLEPSIGQRELAPWGDEVLVPTTPVFVAELGGRTAVAARTPTVGLYAMALRATPLLRVARSIDPEVDYTPQPPGVDLNLPDQSPLFLVSVDGKLIVGHELALPGPGDEYLFLSRVGDMQELTVPSESGCAMPIGNGLQAHAAAVDGGAVVALASGRKGSSCFDDDGIPGPPRYLQTGFVDAESLAFVLAEDEELPEPIAYLDVVSDGDARWVLYQTDGSTSFAPPPVIARRLDEQGAFIGEPVEALGTGFVPPFAAVGMGEGFALAHVDAFDPSIPTLVVRRFDGDGNFAAEGATSASSFVLPLAMALVASPDRDALLLGWSELGDGVADPLLLARFDCVE